MIYDTKINIFMITYLKSLDCLMNLLFSMAKHHKNFLLYRTIAIVYLNLKNSIYL